MPAEIIITTNDGVIDLYQGAEDVFYITRQIHDLHNFQTRNADFSKNLEIPPTPNNLSILDAAQNSPSEQGVTCSVSMGGVTIAPVALMYFVGTQQTNEQAVLRIQILFGNFNFINSIRAGTIDEINWADLALIWSTANIVSLSSKTTDIVWAVCDWAALTSEPPSVSNSDIDIFASGFFMYAREIIKRIIDETEFTLVVDANVPADFNKVAIACPMTQFLTFGDFDGIAINASVAKVDDQTVNDTSARVTFESDAGQIPPWDDATQEFVIPETQDYRVEFKGRLTHLENGARPASILRIRRNGNDIATFLIDFSVVDLDFYLFADIVGVAGDLIFCVIESFVPQTILTIDGSDFNTSFSITTPGSVISTVQPADFIPKVERKTFFTAILNMFNLVMITNDIEKTVTLKSFNDVFISEQQDLTDILDLGGVVDIVPGIDSIAKDSNFTWENDNLLRNDFNLTIRFENNVLESSTDVIALPFSAIDPSSQYIIFDSTEFKGIFPMIQSSEVIFPSADIPNITVNATSGDFTLDIEVEFTVGDWFAINSTVNSARVQSKTSSLAGSFAANPAVGTGGLLRAVRHYIPVDFEARLAILDIDGDLSSFNITDGRAAVRTPLTDTSVVAFFPDRIRWSGLATDYYADILNALQKPQVIKANFNLDIFTFIHLDHLRPVYIAQFNAFYYINKIEQFKLNKTTRLELIRISTLDPDVVLGAFDEGFDEGYLKT